MYEVGLSFTIVLIAGYFLFIDGPMIYLDAIDRSRRTAIKTIIQYIHDTIANLGRENTICYYECDCIMLGALTKLMLQMGLFSLESKSNYQGLSFARLTLDLRGMKHPGSYNALTTSSHSCVLSLSSNIYSILDRTEKSLEGLDLESFTKLRES